MAGELGKHKPLAELLQTIDELAEAQSKFDKGEIKYKQLADVTDKVLAIKRKIDPHDRIKITRTDEEKEQHKEEAPHNKGKKGGKYVIINGKKVYAKTLAKMAARAAAKKAGGK